MNRLHVYTPIPSPAASYGKCAVFIVHELRMTHSPRQDKHEAAMQVLVAINHKASHLEM